MYALTDVSLRVDWQVAARLQSLPIPRGASPRAIHPPPFQSPRWSKDASSKSRHRGSRVRGFWDHNRRAEGGTKATSIKTEDACSWMENFCGTKEERIFCYSVWYFWFFRAECGLDERSCHEGVRWIRGLESSPPQLGNKFYTRVLSKYFKNFIYHSFQTSGLTNSLLFSEWKIKWWSGENRKARKEKWSHYLTRMEIFEFNSDKNFLSAIHRSISKHIKYRFYELEFYNPPMIFYPSYDRFYFIMFLFSIVPFKNRHRACT